MKRALIIPLLLYSIVCFSQQVISSVNCGAFNTNNLIFSVGEIFVLPANPNEANSGLAAVTSRIYFYSTGTGDEILSDDLRAYPNPVSNSLMFETSSPKAVEQVFIFDGSGKLLTSPFVSADRVDVSALPKGIYFFKTDITSTHSFKIIKQ